MLPPMTAAEPVSFDERGWLQGQCASLGLDQAILVFIPTAPVRLHSFDLLNAARLWGASLSVSPEKHYPSGAVPLADLARFEWSGAAGQGAATVRTFPAERAPTLVAGGLRSAEAMGGQGMDALVKRCCSLVQISEYADLNAGLFAAALFARALLGPIRLPFGEELLGVKSARERLGV